MNRIYLSVALASLISSTAAAEELKVFNWAEYIGPGTIEAFESESKIDVTYDTYESIETLETRILAGGSGFDIAVASGASVHRFIQADLLQPLDKASLSNIDNLNPVVMDQVKGFDPEAKYLVPYMWGTIGLGYNPAKIAEVFPDADSSDLDLIFKPENAEKLAECGLAIIDSPNEILGIVLNYLGKDPYTKSKGDMKAAQDLMTAIRPHVRYFDSVKPIDDLATGEICAALMYSGDAGIAALAAEETGNNIEVLYSIPKQGTLVWVDSFVVLADAANSAGAHQFLDYMLRPEVIANSTDYLFYANANSAATKLVNPEISGDPSIYPTPEVMANLYSEHSIGNKAQRLRTRTWTRIKTGN